MRRDRGRTRGTTEAPTLAQVLAHLKQHPPAVKDKALAAKATALVRRWGLTRPSDVVSRPLVNMVRHGKTSGDTLSGRGLKGRAIFQVMATLRLIPGVPREFLRPQAAAPARPTWRWKYYELLESVRGHAPDREVTIPMLTKDMLKFYGLERNPVYDEIRSDKDIWWSEQHEAARDVLIGAAEEAHFIRLSGERGSGKTLVANAAKRAVRARTDITLCEPSPVLSTVLTPLHLVSTVVQAIKRRREERDEVFAEAANPVKRALSMRSLLVQELHQNRHVVLWVDESHELRAETVKGLKRLMDEQHAGRRLIGIVLIGQHAEAFNPRAADLSEVTLRMQTLRIEKMHDEMPAYLRFKIERAGGTVGRVITKPGLEAIAERCPFPLDANAMFARLLIDGFTRRLRPIGEDEVETLQPAVNQDFAP